LRMARSGVYTTLHAPGRLAPQWRPVIAAGSAQPCP
jgi:hypothetical protein